MHAPCSYNSLRGPLYSYRCGKPSPALHPYRSGNPALPLHLYCSGNPAPHLVAGDHMVARLDRGDSGSDALDDAGGLVPQDAWEQALGRGRGDQSRLFCLRPQTPPHATGCCLPHRSGVNGHSSSPRVSLCPPRPPGELTSGSSPSSVYASVWHSAVATMRMRTSPACGGATVTVRTCTTVKGVRR